MDNNLLKQLIAQHRRVVIPDFGAFLKKESPEGEQLVFSPFLRKDDGVVTDAIIGEYGVESEDARAMVAEFVIYLRQSLAASGRYYIEGVGMLAADANGTITLKEGEMPPVDPEPEEVLEPVEPEAVPVSSARPQMQGAPQQVRMQAQTQVGAQGSGGATRPQSIQVQPQPQPQQVIFPPVQQTMAPPVPPQPIQQPVPQPMPQQQSFGGYPGVQQQPMRAPMPQQPVQGYPAQQPMAPPMPRPQPQMSQQPMRGPMPGAGIPQQMTPPMPQQRPQVPPSQRQPQQPMQGNGGMPPRGPQDPNMPQQPQQQRVGMPNPNGGGRGPGGPGGKPGQPQRRPGAPRRNRPPKTKADMWLVIAIIAALVVIAIMVYSFIVSGNKGDIDMEMINAAMAPVQDSTAVVTNPGEGGL